MARLFKDGDLVIAELRNGAKIEGVIRCAIPLRTNRSLFRYLINDMNGTPVDIVHEGKIKLLENEPEPGFDVDFDLIFA